MSAETRCAAWLRAALCATSALAPVAACSDGVSEPLIVAPEYADAGLDADLAWDPDFEADWLRGKDGGRTPTYSCESLEKAWNADHEAEKLVEHFNKVRANPVSICGQSTAAPALSVRPELECVARLRLKDEMPARTGSIPQFYAPDSFQDRESMDLMGRLQTAGIADGRVVVELIITNATSAQGVADALSTNFLRVCPALMFFRAVGIARVDHAWVVAFATSEWQSSMRTPGLSGR